MVDVLDIQPTFEQAQGKCCYVPRTPIAGVFIIVVTLVLVILVKEIAFSDKIEQTSKRRLINSKNGPYVGFVALLAFLAVIRVVSYYVCEQIPG